MIKDTVGILKYIEEWKEWENQNKKSVFPK